ncbi:MAG: Crp/Fnr family transcriptional regulator [Bacteroidales bacterium]|nr:Crp/Fnr family transcriptional regulator [Bacteroidales bacterium]MCF8392205.1 Crp/Fnr family transcriptional regulator [Bacteroidales bacterium]
MPNISEIQTTSFSQYLPFSHLLTLEQSELIERSINVVKYKKKDVIFKQDTRTSNLLFIKSGLVKIYKEGRNERVVILNMVDSGKFIGLLSVFGESLHQYSAEAVNDAEICDLDLKVFKEILEENFMYNFTLLKKISTEGLFIFDRLLSLSHKQLPGRIADVILYFSESIYKSEDFTFPLSRKELADFAGTTKESFIRTLTEFKNDKIIEIDGAHINVKSMALVKTLSQLG